MEGDGVTATPIKSSVMAEVLVGNKTLGVIGMTGEPDVEGSIAATGVGAANKYFVPSARLSRRGLRGRPTPLGKVTSSSTV